MPLFEEQISRKPDLYKWTKDYMVAIQDGSWNHREFSFSSDIHDFKTSLTEDERQVIVKTLSAIGQIEIAVKKFWAKLGDNLPHPSISDLGYIMAYSEVVHNLAYENLLGILGLDDIFEENLKLDIIKGRVNYLKKYTHRFYTDSKKQYIYALALFTLFIENVSLFSQFYIILWFGRYKNVLKDTNQQVMYTKSEEDLHSQIGVKLIQVLRKEYPELFDQDLEDKILHEAQVAFDAESKIIDWILTDYKGERLNSDILKEYIKDRINKSVHSIGYKKIFTIDKNLKRDFEWMDEEVLGNNVTDFFHKKPVNYSKNFKNFSGDQLF